jgi:hypothetical protein
MSIVWVAGMFLFSSWHPDWECSGNIMTRSCHPEHGHGHAMMAMGGSSPASDWGIRVHQSRPVPLPQRIRSMDWLGRFPTADDNSVCLQDCGQIIQLFTRLTRPHLWVSCRASVLTTASPCPHLSPFDALPGEKIWVWERWLVFRNLLPLLLYHLIPLDTTWYHLYISGTGRIRSVFRLAWQASSCGTREQLGLMSAMYTYFGVIIIHICFQFPSVTTIHYRDTCAWFCTYTCVYIYYVYIYISVTNTYME